MPQLLIREFAPAKVNLTLKVHGRRTDGYHELTSLVVFADVGDALTLEPAPEFSLSVTGPMAARIDGPNLIAAAANKLAALSPDVRAGRVTLHKILPVGAGVGGGSSDVAAYLRAVRTANRDLEDAIDWMALALTLGADVPVCLAGETTWMCGLGDVLHPPSRELDPIHAVLINPGLPVPTAAVFRELKAGPVSMDAVKVPEPETTTELLRIGNDLEEPALRVAPEIGSVRAALEKSRNARSVHMSGSGATYFGIYDTASDAGAAAGELSRQHPDWWVVPTVLGKGLTSKEDRS